MKLENITSEAARRRSYEDSCAAAHALDLVGERWALLVIRELMPGPKRFGDIRAGLPGISANTLTQRLDGLEAAGILRRRTLPPPASVSVYELTTWGYESEPVFQALGRWAVRSPSHDPTLAFSAASLLLSLRTMLDVGRADGLALAVGLRLGAETFLCRLAGGELTFARGPVEGADLVLAGAPAALASVIYGGRPLADAEAAGALAVSGDRAAAERFVTLFPLPPKAPAPD